MSRKLDVAVSTEKLKQMYLDEGMTLNDLCNHFGIKSPITMARILNDRGISTNRNKMRSLKTRKGMSHEEFKEYLIKLYVDDELSLNTISRKLNITQAALRRYFIRYDIEFRDATVARKMMRGSKAPNWKGGRNITSSGYVEIYKPNHPQASVRGYVYEHRLVMEKHLGRLLKNDEVVHHIDFDKTNNKISNLQLMSNSEHIKLHAQLDKKLKKGA